MVGHPIGTYHPTHGVVSHLVGTKFCHCGWSWGAYHPTHCCGWSSGARTIPPMVVVGHQVHGPSHPTHCCGWSSVRTLPYLYRGGETMDPLWFSFGPTFWRKVH